MFEKLRHKTQKKISHGKYYPLGATLQEDGVNFALYSKHAEQVFLLLFDDVASSPTDIIKIDHKEKNIWHVFVEGLKKGQLYGFKVNGESNLLIDPYAKALTGKFIPKSIVMGEDFDWQGDSSPDIPFDELIIYETHLKGFTRHHSSKVKHPGTYLGFIEKICYLKSLGINAVEFLPLQESYTEDFLAKKGLTNYWGYNTIGFFAPESSYSSKGYPGCQVDEFKTLVRELHKAGIEVIMDVVYNHTGEGDESGPTLCFRGIDNPTYYCCPDPNYSGCGNSLNPASQIVIEFIMDSLRHWVKMMHVDGFRFDLATVLGREGGRFKKTASFFDAISQDPILNRVKLIAEPWDVETYQLGNFPSDWAEWNGKFRDTVRKFWKGDANQTKDLSLRLTGSPDLYGDDGRLPHHSINFVTCHDGFTLNDLVSLDCVTDLRMQLVKNYFCCLLFSLGTPMILGGDEFLRSQNGDGNAYCQDNETSWFNWELFAKNKNIFDFCRKAVLFRKKHVIPQNKEFIEKLQVEKSKTLCYTLGSVFYMYNGDSSLQYIKLPPVGKGWHRVIDTSLPAGQDFLDEGKEILISPPDYYLVNPRSTVVLKK